MTEDDIYRTSTQYRLWSFTPETLAALRATTNASATSSVRASVQSSGKKSPNLKANDGSQTHDSSLRQDEECAVVDCLTVEEEQKLVRFHCVETLEFVDFCEYPTVVKARSNPARRTCNQDLTQRWW